MEDNLATTFDEGLDYGQKVAPAVAKKEIKDWLDFKKISATKRKTLQDNIEVLEDALVSGYISIDEQKRITHNLKFPIQNADKEVTVEQLVYKPRLTVEAVNIRTRGVKTSDTHGLMLAYVGALTNKPVEILNRIDTEDLGISQAVASFFI